MGGKQMLAPLGMTPGRSPVYADSIIAISFAI